jgi:hypothetical protein
MRCDDFRGKMPPDPKEGLMDPKIFLTFGRAALIAGAVIIAFALYLPPRDVNSTRMAVGLAGSFMALAAIVCLSAAAVMSGSAAVARWKICGALGEGIGAVMVAVAAWRGMLTDAPTWNHVAIGLAGAFILLAGIICNLTGEMLTHTRPNQASSSASA